MPTPAGGRIAQIKMIDRSLIALLAAMLLLCGCAQTTVPAAKLPNDVKATVETGAATVPLSGLAGVWSQSDVIYAGDVLSVAIVAGVEDEPPRPWLVRVGDNGVADVPVIGQLQVAGLRFPQAEIVVRNEGIRRGMYVNPTVSISLNTRETNRVTVMGAVELEGVFDIPAVNSNVLAAIMRAKGLSKDAGLQVEIRTPQTASAVAQVGYRPGQESVRRINLAEIANGSRPNLHLEDGATVAVLKRPLNTFQVIGLVRRPDQFEMEPDHEYRLLEAIALAGDRTLQIADKVHVIRRLEGREKPVVILASIAKAKSDSDANILLAPGDVVSIEETPVTATVGAVRDFIRFGFSAGIPGF